MKRKQLLELFRNASVPEVSELEGEYLVDILTFAPSLRRFSHRKIIHAENGRTAGYNLLFKRRWGHFSVEEGICSDLALASILLNYNRTENMAPLRGIRDYVRCIEQGRLYIGRYYYLLGGREIFLGYFSLEKVN